MDALQAWKQNEGLVFHVLSFLDVKTLCQKKSVNDEWKSLCIKAIENKLPNTSPKPFQSKRELRDAVGKYCKYKAEDMEEIACIYGYPINKWDVSHVQDFSYVFYRQKNFNEPIGDWNTSNATHMNGMFQYASSFNQPIGSWKTSNATKMNSMFACSSSFNQPIGEWNTTNVTDFGSMFNNASSFNQPIGSWNTANVTVMASMFAFASSFNPLDHGIRPM